MYIIKTDCSGKMVVAFTIIDINYLMVSLFCQLVLPLSHLYFGIPIYIYICGIKFLIWLRYRSCFRQSDKSGYCSLYIQFYKLLWLWFYADLFLNLEFYYNDVEYRHRYFNRQHISRRKNPCFTVYTTALPEEPPSVTSGLRMLVQLAQPALHIRLLCEELSNVYFLHKKFSRLFVLLFRIGYLISRSWLCLRSMCSVHC